VQSIQRELLGIKNQIFDDLQSCLSPDQIHQIQTALNSQLAFVKVPFSFELAATIEKHFNK